MRNKDDLDKRKMDLEKYLKILLYDKELRNSREVIKFLELHDFCPEYLVNPPTLMLSTKEKPGFVVSHVHFIPQHNIFITVCNNKKGVRSSIKIYNFRACTSGDDAFYL